jgi:hypothetical protein
MHAGRPHVAYQVRALQHVRDPIFGEPSSRLVIGPAMAEVIATVAALRVKPRRWTPVERPRPS